MWKDLPITGFWKHCTEEGETGEHSVLFPLETFPPV
jgi:hypothetical protein